MKDLSELKLDLTPEALRSLADRKSKNRTESTSDITIPFPEELLQKTSQEDRTKG